MYSFFTRQLNAKSLFLTRNGGKLLKQIRSKKRKELETKMAQVFNDNIAELSTELKEILLDDMVTAFENRLNVLNSA
jgi:hypothetical protein